MQRTRRDTLKMIGMAAVLVVSLLGTGARAESPMRRHPARRVLAVGYDHAMVLGDGGSIWVWGGAQGSRAGTWPQIELGQPTPVRMPGMTGAVSIAMRTTHSLALMKDGTVQAWGDNYSGQLGTGSVSSTQARVQVQGLTDAVSIAAGADHSLAVRADGTVWAWGSNYRGQLGDGTTQQRTSPVRVVGLTDVVAVSGGSGYSLALRADGTVWAWGNNSGGQLGDGTTQQHAVPAQVVGLTNVVAISAAESYALALREDGTVWVWGFDREGTLGGDAPGMHTAAPIPGLEDVRAISAGTVHALALKRNGTVWVWGSNRFGERGDGTQTARELPHEVPGLHDVAAVAAGLNGQSLVLKKNGTVWGWGVNTAGELGTGTDRQPSPVKVVGLTGARQGITGVGYTMAVRADGSLWTWGDPEHGLNPQPEEATPAPVPGLTQVVSAAVGELHSLALKQDGTVWAWGYNVYGELGDGSVYFKSETPVQAVGLTNVLAVAAGSYHSLALKQDGTVWAWGVNYLGQLGDATLQDHSTPMQVQGIDQVVSIYANWDSSVALRQDGTVWLWGSDLWPSKVPRQVIGLDHVVAVAVDYAVNLALRSDGTIWEWVDQGPGLPAELHPLKEHHRGGGHRHEPPFLRRAARRWHGLDAGHQRPRPAGHPGAGACRGLGAGAGRDGGCISVEQSEPGAGHPRGWHRAELGLQPVRAAGQWGVSAAAHAHARAAALPGGGRALRA